MPQPPTSSGAQLTKTGREPTTEPRVTAPPPSTSTGPLSGGIEGGNGPPLRPPYRKRGPVSHH
eukprot:11210157-Alexandrium_andersonii.AAC.1